MSIHKSQAAGPAGREPARRHRKRPAGFSLIEVLLLVAASTILAAMAIPVTTAALSGYQLSGAVSSITGAIQSTRYQAIRNGYMYQLYVNNETNTFQVLSEVPPATSFSNVGNSVPITSSGALIGAAPTFQFKANGSVITTSGPMSFTVSYGGTTKTITVSKYGSFSIQ